MDPRFLRSLHLDKSGDTGLNCALYGTSSHGGAFNDGSIFRLALDGTFTTLHDFSLGSDGAYPYGGVVEASDGNFYGTANLGGQFGNGFVFRVTPAGLFRIVYSFGAQSSGDAAYGSNGLIQGTDGFLYGTSPGGRSPNGDGALFRLDLQGTESVVHSFAEFKGDGLDPLGGLLEATDGLIYGTTQDGGQFGGGSVFRADPSNVIPVLTVSPTSGSATEASTLVTVTGLGFQDGARVWMGDRETVLSTISPTELSAFNPLLTPGTLVHVAVLNPDGSEGSLGKAFLADFLDVAAGATSSTRPSRRSCATAITAGCGSGQLLRRRDPITRAQMAVFLLKAVHGGGYVPAGLHRHRLRRRRRPGTVRATGSRSSPRDGVTGGCGGGDYCPDAPVTRAQMAVFLLKTLARLELRAAGPRRARSSATCRVGRVRGRRGSRTSAGARNHRRLPGLAAALLPRDGKHAGADGGVSGEYVRDAVARHVDSLRGCRAGDSVPHSRSDAPGSTATASSRHGAFGRASSSSPTSGNR